MGEFDERAGRRGDPPRAAARGPGLLRAQPGARHRAAARRACASWCPRRGSPWPTARWTRAPSSRWCVDFWEGRVRRAGVHHHHRVRHRHADGEHPGGRAGRPAGPGPAPPAAGPGRPRRPAGLRLPLLPPGPPALRGGLRAAQDHRRDHRAGLGVPHRHARPGDPRRGQPAGHRPVGPRRRGRLRPLRPDGQRGHRRAERGAGRRSPTGDHAGAADRRPTCRPSTWTATTCAWTPTAGWPRCTTAAEVDDIAAEWADRFGPVPEPAASLLQVAHLRAECVRTGVSEITVTKAPGAVRRRAAWPASRRSRCRQSKQMRLARLYKGAVYKDGPASSSSRCHRAARPGRCWWRPWASLCPRRPRPRSIAAMDSASWAGALVLSWPRWGCWRPPAAWPPRTWPRPTGGRRSGPRSWTPWPPTRRSPSCSASPSPPPRG